MLCCQLAGFVSLIISLSLRPSLCLSYCVRAHGRDELRKQGFDISKMGRVLRESLPYIISNRIDSQSDRTNCMASVGQGQTWEPAASHEVLRAQLQQIIRAMEQAVAFRGESDASLLTTGPQLDERTQLL
jgi:hypothetical protein|eukprot:COSAG02_NODE_9594_length_2167_cov_4.711799_3_plen_130_part_00